MLATVALTLLCGAPLEARVRAAVSQQQLRYRLTTAEEVVALLGPAASRVEADDGGQRRLTLGYDGARLTLAKYSSDALPFTLRRVEVGGAELDLGASAPLLVLRDLRDLQRLPPFDGLLGVSLAQLDLRSEGARLGAMSFDSQTRWPDAGRLPQGFDPRARLERGKDPGLGVRGLHRDGVDGRGVGIAIIDQPLLRDHVEYQGALVRYEALGVAGVEPQMHAPAVASIAVGKTTGVAPRASLSFFAVPTWKADNEPVARALELLVKANEGLPPASRVRVVSISAGGFARWKHPERWRAARALAEQAGLLVLTCEPGDFPYGTLARAPDAPADEPASYTRGKHSGDDDAVRVPGAMRSYASERGPDIYTFDAEGGLSWATPWLAGLAALAFQVNPEARPAELRAWLVETATPTRAGPVVNPRKFIERARAAHPQLELARPPPKLPPPPP